MGGHRVEPGSNGLFETTGGSGGLPTPLLLALIAVALLLVGGAFAALRGRVPALAQVPLPRLSQRVRLPRPASRASAASVVGLAAALAAASFVAKGGADLGRATGAELGLVLAGGAIVAAALLRRGRRRYGAGAVVALAALTALSAVSITWSVAPGTRLRGAGRMLAYLAVFSAAVAAARLPRAAPRVVQGGAAGPARRRRVRARVPHLAGVARPRRAVEPDRASRSATGTRSRPTPR